MPLTPLQAEVVRLLAANRSSDSHLAGGAALHFEPTSKRYSNDLDYFHDSAERVAAAFGADRDLIEAAGMSLTIEMNQPGYIRARVLKADQSTKVEWSTDSAWRFMPTQEDECCGYRLHPVDVAINKVLALAGRDEPRDLVDVILIDEQTLPLGALCWAAAGKDPGFTPLSLLELLRRRGKVRPEELRRLRLAMPLDPTALKRKWLAALAAADTFVRGRPPEQMGCLYYSPAKGGFVGGDDVEEPDVVPHFGRPGGILPWLIERPAESP